MGKTNAGWWKSESGCLWGGGYWTERDMRELSRLMEIFYIVFLVVAVWAYTDVKTSQTEHLISVILLSVNYTSIKKRKPRIKEHGVFIGPNDWNAQHWWLILFSNIISENKISNPFFHKYPCILIHDDESYLLKFFLLMICVIKGWKHQNW